MFARFKEKLMGGAKRLNGNTDLLEGIAAACVLTGAADGDLDDQEAQTALDRLLAHETISASFTSTQIEQAFDKQASRARQGMSGRLGLKRELDDVKAKCSEDDREMLLMIAIDVALADGDISEPEKKALDDVAKRLDLSLARYLD